MFSLYHFTVAVRKGTDAKVQAKKTSRSARGGRGKNSSAGGKKVYSWAILFWLAFAILIFGLFIFNREAIGNSIHTIQNELARPGNSSAERPVPPPASANPLPGTARPDSPSAPVQPKPAVQPEPAQRQAPVSTQTAQPPQPPQAASPAAKPPVTAQPAAKPTTQTSSQTVAQNIQPKAGQETAELRDRVLYFSQVDRSGSILRVKVNRKLPVSDSPMTDVIQALVAGPTADEKRRGLISLIPQGTRMLSATVRGETAYISFSEDFQYNTYGVEGYAGQLRQIVFTATEFLNVKDVQILIEGRRLDYLGEGIWIGSPISRDTL